MDLVRKIARAVLYDGYLLWPNGRAAALKDQQRGTAGGILPEPYARAHEGDAWLAQTQCLLLADPVDTVAVHVRFLQLVTCDLARFSDGRLEPVPELVVGGARHVARQEAREREAAVTGLDLAELLRRPAVMDVDILADQQAEWLGESGVRLLGWEELRGRVEIQAERLRRGVFRLTVKVMNTTRWQGDTRAEAMKRGLISAHTVLSTDGGRFVSLIDPPDDLRRLAAGCHNVGTWPVLVGEEGERHTMLSAPIILYDYPRSPAELFDAAEIDRFLTLSTLAHGEREQQES
ncbi:hypothetical protein HII36_45085 [Nonomuraea sp. NN258]|uniref:hypothetical protein n=1 Tax=Nonomuraea antri TaxID=2730852 RepID=UPI0015699B30|nr:hypothetical protein [Nonomuraea antri]NRQ38948.1 hypothetical protein [Nonomuraea antri]